MIAPDQTTADYIKDALDRETLLVCFNRAYHAAYGRLLVDLPIHVMNYRVTVIGRRPKLDMALLAPAQGKPAAACQMGTRDIYVDGKRWNAPVYERLELVIGSTISGPALLEQPDATIFVDPGLGARVDDVGNLVIEPE